MHRTKRFDDRAVDFHSGRKVSPPMSERRTCACCGLRIVKGFVMSNGDAVDEDGEDIIVRATSAQACGGVRTAEEFDDNRHRSSGWKLKTAVRRYLGEQVFADATAIGA